MFSGKLAVLGALERKVLWIGIWMIHHADSLRQDCNVLKVGGRRGMGLRLHATSRRCRRERAHVAARRDRWFGLTSPVFAPARRREQPKLRESAEFCQGVIDGAYRWRKPGPGCDLVIAGQETVATEVIPVAGMNGQDPRDVGVPEVTSANRLNAGWQAAKRTRSRRRRFAESQIERLLAPLPHDTRIITVIDGRPATLNWLGDARGHIVTSPGVEHFGQSGTETDLRLRYGLDKGSIAATAQMVSPGPPVRLAAVR